MSFIKQTIFIARKGKELHLEVELFNLQSKVLKQSGSLYFEVYKSDDCNDEFLVYEEWNFEDDYKKYLESPLNLEFQKTSIEFVLKKENLPSI